MDTPSQERKGLRVLSIDGGGVRGYSPVLILKKIREVMQSQMINHGPEVRSLPLYKYFDLIVGVSTGGLIAIMLGRLRMTLEEVEKAYQSLSKDIFGHRKRTRKPLLQKYSARKREKAIKDAIRTKLQDDNAKLFDEFLDEGCRVAVTSIPANIPYEREEPEIHKSYCYEGEAPSDLTIVEAAMATTAATMLFKPALIGSPPEKHIDASFGFNNPAHLARVEAQKLWPNRPIDCMLSIGTGKKNVVNSSHYRTLWRGIVNLIVDTKKVERLEREYFDKEYPGRKVYFRFNVDRGISGIKSDQYKKLNLISSHTKDFLERPENQELLGECARSLWAFDQPPISGDDSSRCLPDPLSRQTRLDLARASSGIEISRLPLNPSLKRHLAFQECIFRYPAQMEIFDTAREMNTKAKDIIEAHKIGGEALVTPEAQKLLKDAKIQYERGLLGMVEDDKSVASARREIEYRLAEIDIYIGDPEQTYYRLKAILKDIPVPARDKDLPTLVEILWSLSILCRFYLDRPEEAEDYMERREGIRSSIRNSMKKDSRVASYLVQLNDQVATD